ncbi:MAG: MFS transporter [Anaerolineales bacterium]|uniref:MFS transporter n=1 Tax=Candidatus Desulfolinea nitratireducens TaxID=2841698 RepID=A0A8J6NLZ2_9CHLR|nr:MFS transporter [Candidatus Desulfolinea nitratireducens]MBL6960863.1 MFS transporter [Anaerolineales bacterium]
MNLFLFTFTRTIFNTAYRMAYPFLGVFARALGVDIETMSLALTVRSIGGGITPFVAPLADSRGRKFGMLLGVGLFTLSMALVVFWPTFPVLFLSMLFAAIGKYVFDPAMQAFLSDRISYEKRGRVIAITELGWSLSFVLGVPLMGFLIARDGWMAPFPLLTLLGLLTFFLVVWQIPKDETPVGTAATVRMNFRNVLSYAPALAGLSVGLWMTVANEVVNLIFGVWLEDSFGLQIAALGASAAVIGVSELGGEGLVAIFSDKLGKERAVAFGLVANSLAALLLPLLGRTTFGALLGLFFFYITFEFTIVSILPMMTEVMPSARATLMSFNVAALSLGRAIGAPLGPFLYRFGFPVVALGAVLFNFIALMALRRLAKSR